MTAKTGKRLEKPSLLRKDHLDITVLSGGPGGEREVSLQSGRTVAEALSRLGHSVTVSDISPDDLSALDRPADFVFIALHGEFGEDGTLQAVLESRGIRYCGSGAAASRLAMHKVDAKRRCESAAIPTPRYVHLRKGNAIAGLDGFPIPAVVKPVSSGSSVDITIARGPDGLKTAAAELLMKYGEALIERFVAGPELTVGILGDLALPVCEIRTKREFYDYQAKYFDDDTEYLFDLTLPSLLLDRVRALSLEAHQALGCRVFSRVDWRVDADCAEPFLLEVNTIPGFTTHSLLPKAAARVGIGFDELCQRIVELSLEGPSS